MENNHTNPRIDLRLKRACVRGDPISSMSWVFSVGSSMLLGITSLDVVLAPFETWKILYPGVPGQMSATSSSIKWQKTLSDPATDQAQKIAYFLVLHYGKQMRLVIPVFSCLSPNTTKSSCTCQN